MAERLGITLAEKSCGGGGSICGGGAAQGEEISQRKEIMPVECEDTTKIVSGRGSGALTADW